MPKTFIMRKRKKKHNQTNYETTHSKSFDAD